MKDRVSFEGIGEVMATFYAGEGVKGGQVVKLGGDGEVIHCGAGVKPLQLPLIGIQPLQRRSLVPLRRVLLLQKAGKG